VSSRSFSGEQSERTARRWCLLALALLVLLLRGYRACEDYHHGVSYACARRKHLCHLAKERAPVPSANARPHAGVDINEHPQEPRGPPLLHRSLGRAWLGLRRWLRNYTFAPLWLPERWRHPLVGYVSGVLLAGAAVAVDLLLLHFFPTFEMAGVLSILAILLAAFTWGAVPCLMTTLTSVVLLDYFDIAPRFTIVKQIAALITDDLLLVLVGGFISAIAMQVQWARHRAEALRAEAEKAAERWHIMQFISEMALTHQTVDELLQALLDRVCEALSIENCAILLLDETGQALRIRAARGLEPELAQETRIPLGRGVAGRVALTRETLLVGDLSTFDVVYPYFRERYRSCIGAPLLVDGRVLGVIHMTSALPHHFTQDDARLLEMLASRIALVIDHARLDDAERRAHAETSTRASELEAIFEALDEGLMAFDAQGYILRANAAARRFLGGDIPDQEYFSHSLADWGRLMVVRDEQGQIIPADQLPVQRALRGEVLTGNQSSELILRRLDGREVMINNSAAPIRDAEGHIVGAVNAFRDETERRQLERRTHEALNGLLSIAQILVQAPEEPTIVVEQGLTVNATAQRLATLMAQILGCEHLGIFSFDPEADVLDHVAAVGISLEGVPPWRFEGFSKNTELYTNLLEGKTQLWDMTQPPLSEQFIIYREVRSVLIVPMRLHEHLVGALFLDYGLADHAYTPEELSLAEGSALLAALVLERERLLLEREEAQANMLALREAYRKIDEFLGMASHELRTPLTSVLLGLQLFQRRYERLLSEEADLTEPLFQKLMSLLEQVVFTQRQARRLDRLVNDLLDVSRIQTGRLVMHRQMMDLTTVITEAVQEQRQAAPERSIQLALPREKRVLLSVDPDRISQVVANYLTNALKYSAEDQPVEVGLETAGDVARLWVRDHGPGLSLEEQERIWERFHRVPGVEVRSGSGVGLGLGLYISRTIIEAHQGHVGVQSAPGAGATFWFTLPLPPADAVH